MTFEEALSSCKQGSHITRSSWVRKRWIFLYDLYNDGDKWLCYRRDRLSQAHIWIPQQTDILAEDWEAKAGRVN